MIMISAIKKATILLKKLFCNEGRSPDNLTKAFMNANDNADNVMKNIPLYLEFINLHFLMIYFFISYVMSFILPRKILTVKISDNWTRFCTTCYNSFTMSHSPINAPIC